MGGGGLAGPPGDQGHAVGGHERGVEADAELADHLGDRLLGLPLLQPLDHLAGARLGDRADVGDHLLAAHADAVVGDGEGACLAVRLDADLQRLVAGQQLGAGQRLEAEPVEGVGRVRDQLAEKDLFVRVQRMDHQVEELPGFGLKLQGLDGRSGHECPPGLWVSAQGRTQSDSGSSRPFERRALGWEFPLATSNAEV